MINLVVRFSEVGVGFRGIVGLGWFGIVPTMAAGFGLSG